MGKFASLSISLSRSILFFLFPISLSISIYFASVWFLCRCIVTSHDLLLHLLVTCSNHLCGFMKRTLAHAKREVLYAATKRPKTDEENTPILTSRPPSEEYQAVSAASFYSAPNIFRKVNFKGDVDGTRSILPTPLPAILSENDSSYIPSESANKDDTYLQDDVVDVFDGKADPDKAQVQALITMARDFLGHSASPTSTTLQRAHFIKAAIKCLLTAIEQFNHVLGPRTEVCVLLLLARSYLDVAVKSAKVTEYIYKAVGLATRHNFLNEKLAGELLLSEALEDTEATAYSAKLQSQHGAEKLSNVAMVHGLYQADIDDGRKFNILQNLADACDLSDRSCTVIFSKLALAHLERGELKEAEFFLSRAEDAAGNPVLPLHRIDSYQLCAVELPKLCLYLQTGRSSEAKQIIKKLGSVIDRLKISGWSGWKNTANFTAALSVLSDAMVHFLVQLLAPSEFQAVYYLLSTEYLLSKNNTKEAKKALKKASATALSTDLSPIQDAVSVLSAWDAIETLAVSKLWQHISSPELTPLSCLVAGSFLQSRGILDGANYYFQKTRALSPQRSDCWAHATIRLAQITDFHFKHVAANHRLRLALSSLQKDVATAQDQTNNPSLSLAASVTIASMERMQNPDRLQRIVCDLELLPASSIVGAFAEYVASKLSTNLSDSDKYLDSALELSKKGDNKHFRILVVSEAYHKSLWKGELEKARILKQHLDKLDKDVADVRKRARTSLGEIPLD